MSALGVSDQERFTGGQAATFDPFLGAVLGSLGFELRRDQPVSLVYNGSVLLRYITRNTGELAHTVNVQIVFEDRTRWNGETITLGQVKLAFALAKIRYNMQVEGETPSKLQQQEEALLACNKRQVSEPLRVFVQGQYDAICNLFVFADVIENLARDPFIQFTRLLKDGKIATAVNPLNHDGGVMKQAEKLMRR